LLSNLETDTEKLLQIVLTGQPELRQKLGAANLRQLRQRVAIEHHVLPLRLADTAQYLRHRIEVAGGRYEDVFEPGVESVFHEFSQGCPRLMSLLADRVMLAAFSKQLRPVPTLLVERKAKEMAAIRLSEAPATEVPKLG
jgi:general secretion pathway protein A